MVTEGGQGGEPAVREGREHPVEIPLLAGGLVRDEVAGEGHDVGLEPGYLAEGVDEVVLVDPGSHVEVAELDEGGPCESRGQPGDGQGTMDEFDPVGLDPPSVEADPEPGRAEGCRTAEESAAGDAFP
jgi:hypothetical protein